jgi:hypothetical protein
MPPAAPVAMATARMHVNSYSSLLDEVLRLHSTHFVDQGELSHGEIHD